MDDTNITITEALYIVAIDSGRFDGTNLTQAVRNAQLLIADIELAGQPHLLHVRLSPEEVDSIIIGVSGNGSVDIFS
jgi:hypothetical protein